MVVFASSGSPRTSTGSLTIRSKLTYLVTMSISATISIDGHDYSSQTAVAIRPYFADQNRYHGWVRLIRLVDTRTNSSRLVVAQRIAPPAMGADDTIPNRPALRYRILFIGANGEVIE